MSRRRYLSTDVSLDPELNDIAVKSEFAALLYTWMIPHAADDATITGDPRRLLAEVMPHRRDKTVEDVTRALDLLDAFRLFEAWDREGATIYFDPAKFYKYQSYIKEQNRRSTPAFALISGKRRKTPENASSLSLSLPLSHTRPLDRAVETVDNSTLGRSGAEYPVDNPVDNAESIDQVLGELAKRWGESG